MAVQVLCSGASITVATSAASSSCALQEIIKTRLKPSNSREFLRLSQHHMNRKCKPSWQIRTESSSSTAFDREAYEAERLRLDAEAREAMMAEAEVQTQGNNSKAWKWEIRKRIWDLMERENISQNPRPVHHRIPNFVGAAAAAQMLIRSHLWENSYGYFFSVPKLASLQAFSTAKCVKVNPDSPQKQVRFLTLSGGKKLLTPQPRLRTGFFSILDATMLPRGAIQEACSSAGVAKYGKPISLDAKLKVDLIVIGSVAVDPRTGARLGKGEVNYHNFSIDTPIRIVKMDIVNLEGFAELEYGMLRYMGAIDDLTLIVTSVHDKQLVNDIPVEKLLVHDVPVDVICTPTQIIHTNTTIPKPQGIYWDRLSPEKLGQIRILRELKKRIEQETGQPLPCGPSEKLPPTAERRAAKQGGQFPT
eukprot:Gb_16825 [translate_table: standard]